MRQELRKILARVFVALLIFLIGVVIYKQGNPYAYPGLENRILFLLVPSGIVLLYLYLDEEENRDRLSSVIMVTIGRLPESKFMRFCEGIWERSPLLIRTRVSNVLAELYTYLHKMSGYMLKQDPKQAVSYVFLGMLLIVALQSIFPQPSLEWARTSAMIAAVVSGAITFYLNRGKLDEIEDESRQEEIEENRREMEFGERYPRINRVWGMRWVVRWMYKEGWGYSSLVLFIFLIGLILHIFLVDWSKGYTYFHSGEGEFYNLIKSFSGGNTNSIYQKNQPIMIYLLGTIDKIFNGNLNIDILRLIISLPTYFINFYIIANLKKINALKLTHRETIFVLIGFNFSYTILFYSSVIRSDIIILTIFNLFLFEYLTNGVRNLLYLILLASLAMAFKGSGFLLLVILVLIINYELIIKAHQKQNRVYLYQLIINIITINIITIGLGYIIFLLLNPFYASNGFFSFFDTFIGGVNKLSSGHYGLFSTNKSYITIIYERVYHFVIFFSPIITAYFIGIILYLIKEIKRFGKQNYSISFFDEKFKITLIVLLSALFFIFMIIKPMQFYRYYFPFLTIFIIISFIGVSKIKLKSIAYIIILFFVAYNSYFIYHQSNNSRLSVDVDEIGPVYIDASVRSWMLPPGVKIEGKITTIRDIPNGSRILIAEQNKYLVDNIIRNRDIYNDEDFFGSEATDVEQRVQLYKDIYKLDLIISTGDNKLFGFYLPYDVWYMTNPNYYVYVKS